MKRIFLKSIILSIAFHLALAGNIRADGFGNNNMQKATEKFGSNNVNKASSGIDPGDDPNKDGQIPISATDEDLTPIGAGWEILSSLGLAYGCYLFLRKKRGLHVVQHDDVLC